MPTPGPRVYLHFWWPVSPLGAPLTADILARLVPYVTRYGQTLQASVFAVGGAADHLHVLLQLPMTRTIDELTGELQAASARFVRDVLNVGNFAWHEKNGGFVTSVGLDVLEKMGDYLRQNWENHAAGAIVPQWEHARNETDLEIDTDAASLPQWLQDAMKNKENR